MPEERRIFTDLTVAENLEVGTKPAAGGEPRAPWTPERLYAIFPNLAEMRGRRASQMSGGEQQMLTIARTLMGNPEAVLLDEPSEGLAPVIVEQMAAAVSRMKAEGIAVLLSEQNLYFAAAVADRTYIIEKGAIRHEGRMADIAADAPCGRRIWGCDGAQRHTGSVARFGVLRCEVLPGRSVSASGNILRSGQVVLAKLLSLMQAPISLTCGRNPGWLPLVARQSLPPRGEAMRPDLIRPKSTYK